MTPRMMIGCAAAILGFCLYSHARMAVARAADSTASAAVSADEASTAEAAGRAGARDVAGVKAPLLLGPALGGKCLEEAPLPGMKRAGSSGLIKAVRFARSAPDRD